MLTRKDKSTVLMCFSPPVMMATFALEIILLIYTLVRNRTQLISRLSAAILLFLALFQLAEYSICEDLIFSHEVWARIGFVSITILPILGIHLIYTIAGLRRRAILWAAYISGFAWFGLFVFYDIFQGYGCNGNYVIFELKENFGGAFFVYYYLWLFTGIGIALFQAKKTSSKNIRRSLQALTAGYFIFMLPTTTVNLISPSTADGLPSIMCGFAVLFALILSLIVIPKALADGRDSHLPVSKRSAK